MIHLGLLGVNTSHADAFARIYNGTKTEAPLIDNAEITVIWGNDLTRIDELATRHHIAERVAHPTDMLGKVDGVVVIDDTNLGALHAELAKPFLEAGVPVFVDKPMTTSYADAVELFDIATRTGAPLMSCSSLRFAVELQSARTELARIGKLSSIISVGPGDWFNYGVHAVELLGAIAGTGATTVHRHAFPERDIAVVGYENGPTAVVETLRDSGYAFELTAYGKNGHFSFEVSDATGFYSNTMREVVKMVETGVSPLTVDQTLEVLAILHAGDRSAERNAAVALTDITGA